MKPISGQPAGWHAHPPSFPCPEGGCGRIYTGPDALRYHFDQYHVNGPRLHQHTAQIQKQSRSGGAHPLRNGMPVSPINATFQQAAYNSQTTGPVSYQSHGPPAAYGSMPPPPVQNQVPCSVSAARPLTDQQAFVESQASKSWPLTAQSLLKDLVIAHGCFTPPITAQDHDKLVGLYESFHADINTLGMNLATNDDVLWQLFRTKVDVIQAEMLQLGELQQTSEGLKFQKLLQKKTGKEPLSTPPTTPVLPTEYFNDGMELWNSSDSNAQARLFRKMLRTAKDPQRLFFECEEYCAETTSKDERKAGDDAELPANRHVSRDTNAGATQRPTPSKTPDPTSTSLDLKSMIDKRLHEMRLKRAIDKQVLESGEDDGAEGKQKRVKVESLT